MKVNSTADNTLNTLNKQSTIAKLFSHVRKSSTSSQQAAESTSEPLQAKIALSIAAHPDDLDFMASGTLAKMAANGTDVYYLILTDGSKGTNDRKVSPRQLIETRRHEQRRAAAILGVKDVFFLDYEDGMLEVTMQLKKDIVCYIRRLKPDVVFAMDPGMLYSVECNLINHPDHRASGQATLDAVFPLARDHLSFPELCTGGLEPHSVKTVLLTTLGPQNYYVDIASSLQVKLDAMAAHSSQMLDLDSERSRMKRFAAMAGDKAGIKYAEGFVRIDVDG